MFVTPLWGCSQNTASSVGTERGEEEDRGGRALGLARGTQHGYLPALLGGTGLATPLSKGEGQISHLLLDICPLPGRGSSLPRESHTEVKSLLRSHETSGEGAGEGNHALRETPGASRLVPPAAPASPSAQQTAPQRSARRSKKTVGERERLSTPPCR